MRRGKEMEDFIVPAHGYHIIDLPKKKERTMSIPQLANIGNPVMLIQANIGMPLENLLEFLYYDKRLTLAETGDILGVHEMTVEIYLKRFGVGTEMDRRKATGKTYHRGTGWPRKHMKPSAA